MLYVSPLDYSAIQFRESDNEPYTTVHWVRHKRYSGGTWPFETVCGLKLKRSAYDFGKAQYARLEDIKNYKCHSCARIRKTELEIETNWNTARYNNTSIF